LSYFYLHSDSDFLHTSVRKYTYSRNSIDNRGAQSKVKIGSGQTPNLLAIAVEEKALFSRFTIDHKSEKVSFKSRTTDRPF